MASGHGTTTIVHTYGYKDIGRILLMKVLIGFRVIGKELHADISGWMPAGFPADTQWYTDIVTTATIITDVRCTTTNHNMFTRDMLTVMTTIPATETKNTAVRRITTPVKKVEKIIRHVSLRGQAGTPNMNITTKEIITIVTKTGAAYGNKPDLKTTGNKRLP